jgi:hypothetical protein
MEPAGGGCKEVCCGCGDEVLGSMLPRPVDDVYDWKAEEGRMLPDDRGIEKKII